MMAVASKRTTAAGQSRDPLFGSVRNGLVVKPANLSPLHYFFGVVSLIVFFCDLGPGGFGIRFFR